MFVCLVSHLRLGALGLALTGIALCQSATAPDSDVLSNREARSAATSIHEATVPPGFSVNEFTVSISVDADGSVRDVSNSHSLPEPLFAAAADAARHWHFRTDRDGSKPHGFRAEITFHGPVTGTVTAADGTPLADVTVGASEWTCCPSQRDSVKTDKNGSFRIEHPGTVLHFLPGDDFQSKALVVASGMSILNVSMDKSSNNFSLANCKEPERGFQRIGWGKYGLQFDVPQREVKLARGKVDVDYVVDVVKSKHSDARVEFWFGPYAMEITPDDEMFVESETFETHKVLMPAGPAPGSEGGVIGADTSGRMPKDRMWRQWAVVGEGARYRNAPPEDAKLFDQIINSACWIPDPGIEAPGVKSGAKSPR